MRIDAIGYIRSDVSGVHQQAHEERLRAHAKGNGYNLRKIIVFGPWTDDPERRLAMVLDRMDEVAAVLVPCVRHFAGDAVPFTIARRAEVVIVTAPAEPLRLSQANR